MFQRKAKLSEKAVADWLPFSYHVTPEIISMKNGSYLSCMRLEGRAHESASAATLANWVRDLNTTLRMSCNHHVSLWSHLVRRRVQEYPDARFNNQFCESLNQKYKKSFEDYSLMVNELYLSVVFDPNGDQTLSLLAKAEKMTPSERAIRQERSIKDLQEIMRALKTALQPYGPSVLAEYEHNGKIFTKAGEFLGWLLNGESNRVPVLRNRLSDYLPVSRPMFDLHGELGELRQGTARQLFGLVEIVDYDETTEPGHLNGLMHTKYELVVTQSFSIRAKDSALAFLKRHQRLLEDAKDAAESQIVAISRARDELASGAFMMGEHHATVRVIGQTGEEVRAAMADVRTSFAEGAIIGAVVDAKATEAAFWAQFPGNPQFRPRPSPITSLNFFCFSPFHNYLSGKPTKNPWGEAVTLLKTDSGTPHYFSFHVTPAGEDSTGKKVLGNTSIIGKAGTGKTSLLGFLLSQSQKYPATIAAFDKDNGMELQIRAMGGVYLPLEVGTPSGWNPLQLDPTPANMALIRRIIRRCASVGCEINHVDDKQIEQALDTVMFHMEKVDRRFSTLLQNLPNTHSDDVNERPSVHARLARWCGEGEDAWMFDNDEDLLDLASNHIYGFDLTELLDQPHLLECAMEYLLHRTDSMIDGRKFAYVFDEFWRYLDVPVMLEKARNKVKTIRKENGIFIYATQEPSDSLSSPIAKTLVQGVATAIFLPNPEADREDYVNGFKLTDTEYEIIRSLPEKSRRFLIKQGQNSTVAQLDLNGFDEHIAILSGTPDSARMAREIIAETSNDPSVWLPVFYQRLGLSVPTNA